ncbi:LacI family DNA-binding transcriptional regulator [Agromyces sp. CFH 90414]|uniref:LacI family DNA-binding transcriptional regulator n=1 Tax=Agromyces agglutinans TaxID=2662258 RepID=A0A6I2F4C4_9MICO|nr:LacI family DNA-binding transcriptional regulator [Agromyces agglutinans]MRG59452.1 LacI family DNA-binding transcriptional regulator [Agromyces agglutinans]
MATISDVARAAGVSISTVSYALSGKRTITASTRARIEDAIRELDYQPHAGARMLAGATTNILALSAPIHTDGHLPTHMRFVTAVVDTARRYDYDVLLLATDDDVSGIRRVAASSLVDGVVAMGVKAHDERVEIVKRAALPAAFIGVSGEHGDGVACVDLDFERAGRLAITTLADAGHRTVGVVGHPPTYLERGTGFVQRFNAGLEAEAAARGIRIDVVSPTLARGDAERAFDDLLDASPEMTAVLFHCNEPVVEAVLRRIRERGLEVPTDLSAFAACASYDTSHLAVPLSSIPLPLDQMCRIAVESALRQVRGVDALGVELIPPVAEDRGSVARPRR